MIAKQLWKYACVLMLWTCISSHVFAQEIRIDTVVYSTLDVDMLGIEDGLSQGMINDVVEDQDGYLWIATKEGLNRYDGSSIKVYRHDPSDTTSIAENYVGRLHVDQDNRLWIATQSKGLDLYVREIDGFVHFKNDPENPGSISTNYPHRVFGSPEGELLVWARDKNELEIATLDEWRLGSADRPDFEAVCSHYSGFTRDGNCWIDKNFLPSNNSKDASGFTADGVFWIHGGKNIVYSFSPEALRGKRDPVFHQVRNDLVSEHQNVLRCLFFNQSRTNAFVTDGHRSIWRIDPVSQKPELYLYLPEGLSVAGPVLIGASNDIWIHTAEDTICRIVPEKSRLEVFSMKGDWVAGDIASPMIEDRFGNVWIPTGGYGLAKISARKKLFFHVLNPESYGADYPTWPYRLESPGKSKSYGGQYWAAFMGACDDKLKSRLSLEGSRLQRSLSMDAHRNVWCALRNISDINEERKTQLVAFNPSGRNQTPYLEIPLLPELTEHHFVPLFFDRTGNLWFGMSDDNGKAELEMYDPNSQNRISFKFPIKADPLHYRFISDWWEDEVGCWWLATVQGVFWLNPKTSEWRHFSISNPIKNSLSMDMTLSLCPDPTNPEDFIWVGTEGAGLNKLNRNTGECQVYDVEDGLPNGVIYGIQSDHRGNLWLSTNRGVCLFNPRTKSTRNFTEKDGLSGNEFNRYEYSKGADGAMYFGGVNGTTAFHPKDFYHDSLQAKVVINGLRILNKPVHFAVHTNEEAQFQLTLPIEQSESLTFPHDIGMITLTYSLLDYTFPDQYSYKYKMEGQDEEWIEAGNAREATYTSLRPGDYTFRVMGLNSHNRWSEETMMAITILPPWWATWWFRTLIVLVVAGLLYALYRYRLAQVVQVERMRNRIAQDLHDEIGSTLSSISLYSAVIRKSANGMPENSKAVLDKISSSTSEMMESMNDIVWTIKADNDHFEHVVNRMRAFAVNMTEARGIALKFEVKGNVEKLHLDMVARKNLYLIFKEAVNNSVKYAQANMLSVEISYQNDQLEMVINDNGCGFEMETVWIQNNLPGGNGLRGMKSRAAEINAQFKIESQPHGGTRIEVRTTIR